MTNSSIERRKKTRLQCSEGFSASKLNNGTNEFELTSINYTHDGIALFKPQPLPDLDQFEISFNYVLDGETVRIERLPCAIVHVHDSDEGVMYGAAFKLEETSAQQIEDLIRIEEDIALKASMIV